MIRVVVTPVGLGAYSAFHRKVEAAAREAPAAHRDLVKILKVNGGDPQAVIRGHQNHERVTMTMTPHPTRHVRDLDQSQNMDLNQLKMMVVVAVTVVTTPKLAAAALAVVSVAAALAAKVHSQDDMRWTS